jgi:hypothetical protein
MPLLEPEDPIVHVTEVRKDDDGSFFVKCLVCEYYSGIITEEKFVEPIRWRHERQK